MFDIAISNLGWKKEEDIKVFELMRRFGINCLEICPFRDSDNLSSAQEMIGELKKYNLRVVALQALLFRFSNLVLFKDKDTNMKLFEHLANLIEFASGNGAKDLVFGCPKAKLRRDMEYKEALEESAKFFSRVAEQALNNDVTFCIEPTPPVYGADFILNTNEAIELVKEVNNESFKVNFDIGASIANGEDIAEMITANIQHIGHIHISEPALKTIDHDYDAHTKISQAMQTSGYSGSVSIEMLPGKQNNLNCIEKTISFVKEVYGNPTS